MRFEITLDVPDEILETSIGMLGHSRNAEQIKADLAAVFQRLDVSRFLDKEQAQFHFTGLLSGLIIVATEMYEADTVEKMNANKPDNAAKIILLP